jgi:hypothetical protein
MLHVDHTRINGKWDHRSINRYSGYLNQKMCSPPRWHEHWIMTDNTERAQPSVPEIQREYAGPWVAMKDGGVVDVRRTPYKSIVMNCLKFPLGHQNAGAIVITTLSGVESDLFLVDPPISGPSRAGELLVITVDTSTHPLSGLRVPSAGEWTAVVVPGPGGQVNASGQVLPAA